MSHDHTYSQIYIFSCFYYSGFFITSGKKFDFGKVSHGKGLDSCNNNIINYTVIVDYPHYYSDITSYYYLFEYQVKCINREVHSNSGQVLRFKSFFFFFFPKSHFV